MHSSIVIVDDSMICLSIAEKLAVKSGFFHEVYTFSNPKRALEHLQERPADVLMSDIEMPHMDGLELMGRISGGTLKIACTTNRDYMFQAYEQGCQEFLLKPLDSDKVHNILRRASMRSAFSKSANIPVHRGAFGICPKSCHFFKNASFNSSNCSGTLPMPKKYCSNRLICRVK